MRGRRTLPMTVRELRAVLADLPDDAGVVFDDDEGGEAVCDWEIAGADCVLHAAFEPGGAA